MNIKMRKMAKICEPYFYMAPAIIIMAAFLGFPIIYNIVISFFKWNLRFPARPFVGLENYIAVISDGKFIQIFFTTLIWTIGGVFLQMVIGIGLALFVDSLKWFKSFLQSIIILPWVIPGVITALMWAWMLQSDMGIINNLIWKLGITNENILWLSDANIALIAVIFVNAWKATPFWFLMILAALQDIPKDQIESANIDGAGYFQVIKNVLIPHLKPIIASTGVITTIWTLNYFDLIWVMTKGGPMNSTSTLPIYTYRTAFEFYDFGHSAALAIISLIIIMIICMPYVKSMLDSLKEEGSL